MQGTRRWGVAVLAVCVMACGHKKTEEGPSSVDTTSKAKTAGAPKPASHEGERPPKPTPTASVTPPKLPKLAAQAAHVTAPKKKKPDGPEAPCGTVWTGEEEIPLECDATARDAHTHLGAPAVALISYDALRAPRGELPAHVDHRLDGFEGRTLNQGKASTCTAFALTSQIDHAIGLWTGKPGDVSPMAIWARYHVHFNAPGFTVGHKVTNDAEWPYDAARAQAWGKCKIGDDSCFTAEEKQKLEALDKKAVAVIEQVERLPENDTLFDVIEAKLAAGRDVGTGGHLPKGGFKPVGEPGSKYIPDFTEVTKGAHAFSIVGYTHADDERYFLVKNSWGEKWGDGGYAWIHEKSLGRIIHAASVVVVDPVGDIGLRRHKRKKGSVAACPAAGHAPDSVDGACKPLCADGSPRHGGYCGTTEDCTKGFVNVSGHCVLAAPVAKGTEPANAIAYACAPSGCVYTIPKGVGGCAEGSCQKSCPAPDFRLGHGKGGLLCLE